MRQINQVSDAGLDAALNHVGPYTPQHIDTLLPSEDILEARIAREGIIRSLTVNAKGRTFDGIRKFDPAHPYSYDMVASAASDSPKSIKRTNGTSPTTFHIGLDVPERTTVLTGDYAYANLGLFAMAVATRVAAVSGSEVLVSVADETRTTRISDGSIEEVDLLYAPILKRNRKITPYDRVSTGGVSGLLESMQRVISSEEDAVFIVSDFQEGFDKKTGTFDWEERIRTVDAELGDRFWPIRLISPAHTSIPPAAIDGLDDLSSEAVDRAYRETAQLKNQALIFLTLIISV